MDDEKNQVKKADKSSKNTERTRNFATVVYEESAPKGWIERLRDQHVEALISPLHDKDTNPDGTLKKAHWHVLIIFPSVKTVAQATVIRDLIGGVGFENVASLRGYARYLCHLDNPEKHRYNEEDVLELSGADYLDIIRRASDDSRALKDMMQFVRDNNVMYYNDLFDYCLDNRADWFDLLTTRYTFAVSTYMKSLNAKVRRAEQLGIDPETGEDLRKDGKTK